MKSAPGPPSWRGSPCYLNPNAVPSLTCMHLKNTLFTCPSLSHSGLWPHKRRPQAFAFIPVTLKMFSPMSGACKNKHGWREEGRDEYSSPRKTMGIGGEKLLSDSQAVEPRATCQGREKSHRQGYHKSLQCKDKDKEEEGNSSHMCLEGAWLNAQCLMEDCVGTSIPKA